MKIWKFFIVFQLLYILLVYLVILVGLIIGYGFILKTPKWLSTITRIILYPCGIVNIILSKIFSNQIHHLVIAIISSAIVAGFFCCSDGWDKDYN